MAKIVITGASGFIGRALAKRLISEGHTVTGLMRHPAEGPWQETVICDLSRESPSPRRFEGIDRVYHLVSKAHALAERPGETGGYHAVIVEGTQRLIDVCITAGVPRLIYMSSVKAMGEGQGLFPGSLSPLDESMPCQPATPYGRAKREAEQRVEIAEPLQRVILRPTLVYGPGQKGNLERMIQAISQGRFPPFPEVNNRRSMVHVETVIDACLAAGENPAANGKAYILADNEAWSTRQLYETIASALGRTPARWSIPLPWLNALARCGDGLGRITRRRWPFDSDTLEKLLGSAWYSNARMTSDLTLPIHSLKTYLKALETA